MSDIPESGLSQLYTALAAAQAKMPNAVFNRTNPHFTSRYADLSAIREATLPALTANGLGILQYTSIADDGEILLHTRLAHKSGQFIEGVYPLPAAKERPQVMGSAMTYAKRYCWAAMCGVASDDDDDANAAHGGGGDSAASAGNQQSAIRAAPKSRPAAAAAQSGALTAGQLRLLRGKLTAAGKDEIEFAGTLGFERLEEIPAASINDALALASS